VLIRQFLKQADCLHQLLIGLDQSILNLTSIVVQDCRSISTKIINDLKTCLAYSVG
jgi:hypothetical protein